VSADILSSTYYANRTFEKVVLTGGHVLAADFAEVSFVRCDFSEAILEACRFADCVFDGCDLTMVQLPECRLSNVTFNDTRVMGVDWTRASWPRLGAGGVIAFSGCVLSHTTFIGLSLPEVRFTGCKATDVDFREADLSRASFENTDLADSIFLKTDLSQADFSRARNYRIDPAHNKISGAKFSLPEALSLLYSMDIEMVEAG
jgi:fluoroquinolone resistance protein